MRESLSKINKEKLKKIIEKTSGNNIKAVMTGIFSTALIQSSSGITALVVAFMANNLLTFSQGVMIMLGSNIGTTLTAFIFSLNIENYALLIIFVAYILNTFKREKIKLFASALMGFGLLFQGIYFMNEAFDKLAKTETFILITLYISKNILLAFFGGLVLAALIQSSSATISLVQNLYFLNLISLDSAVSIMLGANAGTTIASLIVALNADPLSIKAINVNIFFNVGGGILFLIILKPFVNFLKFLETNSFLITNKKIVIAYSHLIYNLVTAIIFYLIYEYITMKKKKPKKVRFAKIFDS